jgi:MoxR-like ATPase
MDAARRQNNAAGNTNPGAASPAAPPKAAEPSAAESTAAPPKAAEPSAARSAPGRVKTLQAPDSVAPDWVSEVHRGVKKLIDNIQSVIYIDTYKLEYIIAAKIAGGHVMLADSHGVGKTSLARALAGSIRWEGEKVSQDGVEVEPFSRIQCTVDLLPQDILGFTRLDGSRFIFNKGPIFAHFVLCDEINLLTPKTQGSFFQAMEEKAVTVEGKTYRLTDPFFIISTMNLKGAHLFPLPAPQLDRFMLELSMGFPNARDEADIIRQHGRDDAWGRFQPVIGSKQLLTWQSYVDKVSIHPDIIDYIVACVQLTRIHQEVLMGASPRTGVKLSRMARALAMVRGQEYVDMDLMKEIFIPAVAHRLVMKDPEQSSKTVLEEILRSVPVESEKRKKATVRS